MTTVPQNTSDAPSYFWTEFDLQLWIQNGCDINIAKIPTLLQIYNLIPPPEISLLTNLTDLTISKCKLPTLPHWIGDLVNLKYLGVFNTGLQSLPRSIGNLKQLKSLYVYHNELTDLPQEIGNLSQLERLECNNNKLTSIPLELCHLKKLGFINFKDNLIDMIHPDILLFVQQNDQIILQI